MKRTKQILALLTVVCLVASFVSMFAAAENPTWKPGDNQLVIGNIDPEAQGLTITFEGGETVECFKVAEDCDEWWLSLAERFTEPEYWVGLDTDEKYQDWFNENNIESFTISWGDGLTTVVPKDGIVEDKSTISDIVIFFGIRDEFRPKPTPTATPAAPATTAPTVPATPTPTAPATIAPTAPATIAPTAPATTAPAAEPTIEPTVEPTAVPDAPKTGSEISTLSVVFMALGVMGLVSLAVVTVKENRA